MPVKLTDRHWYVINYSVVLIYTKEHLSKPSPACFSSNRSLQLFPWTAFPPSTRSKKNIFFLPKLNNNHQVFLSSQLCIKIKKKHKFITKWFVRIFVFIVENARGSLGMKVDSRLFSLLFKFYNKSLLNFWSTKGKSFLFYTLLLC